MRASMSTSPSCIFIGRAPAGFAKAHPAGR
jgi:hypothetical protein